MNKIYLRPIIQYLIYIAFFISSCSSGGPDIYNGDVVNLYRSTAQWIVDGCKAGSCGSEIFQKGNLLVYSRPFLENVSFVVASDGIPTDKLSQVTGNLVNLRTWDEFRTWLLSNGWALVSSGSAYRTALDIGATISGMEFVPIFTILPAEPGGLMPDWVIPTPVRVDV